MDQKEIKLRFEDGVLKQCEMKLSSSKGTGSAMSGGGVMEAATGGTTQNIACGEQVFSMKKHWKLMATITFIVIAIGCLIGSSIAMDEYRAGIGSWYGPDDDFKAIADLLKYGAYASFGGVAIFGLLTILSRKNDNS